ncbi:tellurite resistance protein TerB [bacterium BMS3Abin03]|nr:tellurite resistance protein TerB [bacterium BMS3Abin03]
MFEYLKKALAVNGTEQNAADTTGTKPAGIDSTKKLQIATAALFIEMAKSDGKFSAEERERIIGIMKNRFNLDDECVKELIDLSEIQLEESISLYGFADIINKQLTTADKKVLIKNLWRLIYTDARLDKYEDHLIKLIGGMLNLEHKQIIDAKMLVRYELGID